MIYARCCCDGCCAHPLQPQNVQSREKAPASHGARGETPTMSFVPDANREGKERVKGYASRIQSSRIGYVLVCVRRNSQLRELELLESTRFVLSTVVMIAVFTDGPTSCLVYPPPLSPQNIQLHKKFPAGRGACCGTAHRLLLATAVPIATMPGAGIDWQYFDHYTKFKAVCFIDEGQSADDSGQNWRKTSSCFSKFTSIACVPMAAASSLPITTATTARLRRSCSNSARPTLQSTTVSANGTK